MKSNKIKCIIIIIIVLVFLAFIIIRQNKQRDYKDNIFFQMAISAYGIDEFTYHFIITKDRELQVSFGTRRSDELRKIPYLITVEEKGEKKLSEYEFQKIENMINRLDESNNNSIIVFDGFFIIASYQENMYSAVYRYENVELNELAEEMIELSPIPVILRPERQSYIEKQNSLLFQLAIFDKSNAEGTYVFTVEKNRMLTSFYTFTELYNNVAVYAVSDPDEIVRKEKRMLTEREYQHLKNLAEKINRVENNDSESTESFHVKISYQFVNYYTDIDSDKNPNLLKLTEEIMNLSPMPVILQEASVREAYLGINEKEYKEQYIEQYKESFHKHLQE